MMSEESEMLEELDSKVKSDIEDGDSNTIISGTDVVVENVIVTTVSTSDGAQAVGMPVSYQTASGTDGNSPALEAKYGSVMICPTPMVTAKIDNSSNLVTAGPSQRATQTITISSESELMQKISSNSDNVVLNNIGTIQLIQPGDLIPVDGSQESVQIMAHTPTSVSVAEGGVKVERKPTPKKVTKPKPKQPQGKPTSGRRCIVCLTEREYLEEILDKSSKMQGHIEILLSYLKIELSSNSKEYGLCLDCMANLQKWHIFASAVTRRHEVVNSGTASKEPLDFFTIESRVYKHFRKMKKVKEVFNNSPYGHLVTRHLTDKDIEFLCDRLFRSQTPKSVKTKEVESVVEAEEKLTHFFCIRCNMLINGGKKGFIRHYQTLHNTDPIEFPCDICGMSYPENVPSPNGDGYFWHWVSHFYFFECEDCGKKFPSKKALGQHVLTTHTERSFQCDTCGKKMANKTTLEQHRIRHLPEGEREEYSEECPICKKKFKSQNSLRGHMGKHEGRKDYKCDICNKAFFTYSALRGHKTVHQTARDFVCTVCGKGFKKKKALTEHSTLHTGVKPYQCSICGREIRVKSNLYKHLKVHKKAGKTVGSTMPSEESKPIIIKTEPTATASNVQTLALPQVTEAPTSTPQPQTILIQYYPDSQGNMPKMEVSEGGTVQATGDQTQGFIQTISIPHQHQDLLSVAVPVANGQFYGNTQYFETLDSLQNS